MGRPGGGRPPSHPPPRGLRGFPYALCRAIWGRGLRQTAGSRQPARQPARRDRHPPPRIRPNRPTHPTTHPGELRHIIGGGGHLALQRQLGRHPGFDVRRHVNEPVAGLREMGPLLCLRGSWGRWNRDEGTIRSVADPRPPGHRFGKVPQSPILGIFPKRTYGTGGKKLTVTDAGCSPGVV